MIKKLKYSFVIMIITLVFILQGCSKESIQREQEGEKALPTKEASVSEEQSEDTKEQATDQFDKEEASDKEEEKDTTDNATEEGQEKKLTTSEAKALEAIQILEGHRTKNLTYAPLSDPEDNYNLNIVKNVHMVAVETGEYSINQTKTKFGVGGTDLGISFNLGDTTYIAFGDTFLHEGMQQRWRSNVLAVTKDTDYTDGILFDSMITVPGRTIAKELIPSRKIDNLEMTTIPTGGIAIGETLYMSFMSVRHWGLPGEWDCNYGSIAKSVDYGQNWDVIKELQWPGDSHFCQMAPVIIDDYVYVMGITGGRRGPAKLMRVPIEKYEDFEAYEYLMGYASDGTPLYEKGEEAMYGAYNLLPRAVGELSILYSEYLEEWLVTYIDGTGNIVMRSSKKIDGPYSKPVIVVAQKDFPTLYGAFMNPKWVSEDGTKLGFFMSLFDPVYNVLLMECELER